MKLTTALFPNTLATEANLYVAKDQAPGIKSPELVAAMSATDDSFTLQSGGGALLADANQLVLIGSEILSFASRSGDVCSGLTRAVSGTTAAAHAIDDDVNPFRFAEHHNRMAAELIAIENRIDSFWGNKLTTLWRPNPVAVPSIQAWYRPDEIIAGSADIDANGDLTVWKDRSGHGYDAIPTNTLPAASLSSLNGYATINFATGESISTPSVPRLHGVDATIFAVFRSADDFNATLISQAAGGERTATIYLEFNNEFFADFGNINGGNNRLTTSPPPFGINTWEILTVERSAVAGEVWRNGSSIITSAAFDSIVPTDSQPFYVGSSFRGDIAEVGVCNATGVHGQLEGYLAHKYGLEGLLPAGHLYKSSAP